MLFRSAIGSVLVNFLSQPSVMGVSLQAAGKMLVFFWGGAMVGRFIGSAVLRLVSPGKVLACVAVGAIALIAVSTSTTGAISGYSLLAIGLMNAIMFPTIFSLGTEGLGEQTPQGSGILCTAIVGGALVPYLFGTVADVTGSMRAALLVPVLCYAIIALFGLWAARHAATAQTD